MLPPVMLPLAETDAADTAAEVIKLPPVMLPVADINPPVNKLPPAMLPLAVTAEALVVINAPRVVSVALYVVPLYTTGATVVASTVFVAGKFKIVTVAVIFLFYVSVTKTSPVSVVKDSPD